MTREQKAIELATTLNIYTPYVNDLKKGYRTLFENFGGYSIGKYNQELELLDKINELEKEYGFYVYAVTHELTNIGELYNMLIVPKYKEEWDTLLDDCGNNTFYTYAYCWNKDNDWCSEFGDICVQSAFGGLRRVG